MTSCLKCKTFVKIRRWLITTRVEDGSFSVKKNSCNASTRSAILSTYGKSKKERVAGISSLRQVR